MKASTILFSAMCLIQAVHLINLTLFNGQLNGIAMWISTALFVAGTFAYAIARGRKDTD